MKKSIRNLPSEKDILTSSEADIYPGKNQHLSNAFSAILKNGTRIPAPQKPPIKQSTGQIKHVVGGSVTIESAAQIDFCDETCGYLRFETRN